MDRIDSLRETLDRIRPLKEEHVRLLWPRLESEKPQFVQSTNAIEGNSLTIGETIAVLQHGVTLGEGKPIRDYVEAINGGAAYDLMLSLAQAARPITKNTVLALHEAILKGSDGAGELRHTPVAIFGAHHAPPNPLKVPSLFDAMFEAHQQREASEHPVIAGAKLHFDLLTIHPFVDGNGRTARLVNNLLLIKNGYPPVLIDPIADKPRYFDALRHDQMAGEPGRGEPTLFLDFMADLEIRALEHYVRVLQITNGIERADVGLDR